MNVDNSQCAIYQLCLKYCREIRIRKVDCLGDSVDEIEKQKNRTGLHI